MLPADVLTESGWETTMAPLPMGSYGSCMTYFDDGTYFVLGGIRPTDRFSPLTFVFSTSTLAWSQGPNLPMGIYGHGCGRLPTSEKSSQISLIVAGGLKTG